jgi:HAD superfamily hydrolase (TIGR01490 family)
MSVKLALFDLDHTLIPVDSCGLWAYFLISRTDRAEEYNAIQKQFDEDYFEGVLDINKFMDFEMALLAGFSRRELEEIRQEYLDRFIKPSLTKKALDLVDFYRREGYKTVIVTATHRFPVEPIARYFQVDKLICSEPEEDAQGEFTGGWLYHTFREGKVRALKEYLTDLKVEASDLKNSCFYSDSMNDLPIMKFIDENGGRAVAANPDPRLRKYAQDHGWEILQLFDEVEKPSSAKVEN